ncbi:hypothetical protein ACRAWF_02660 [Streptomyces sp. L7]
MVRSGDVVGEGVQVAAETGADEVHMAADVSGYAQRREQRLRRAPGGAEGRRLHVHDTVTTAVAPGAVTPPPRTTSRSSRRTSASGPGSSCAPRSPRRVPCGSPEGVGSRGVAVPRRLS